MITDEIKSSIEASVLCWLATISKDGTPNVTPKQIFTYGGDDVLLIANIASPGSVRNIKSNPNVCVSFVDVFVQRGFKLIGKAEIVGKADAEYGELHPPLYALAGDDYPIASIIKTRVTAVEPIRAPSYQLFPERSDEERLNNTYQTYGVKPL